MEPLFENSFDLNKETAAEYIKTIRKNRSLWAALIFTALMIGYFLYILIEYGVFYWFALAMSAFMIVFAIVMEAAVKRRDLRALEEQTGGKPYIVTKRFFEDAFTSADSISGGEIRVEYDKLAKMIESKTLIVLQSKARNSYILRKDSFTKGSAEEFKAFIEGRLALKKIK